MNIAEKLNLNGQFEIGSGHFSEVNVQDKVNALSHHGSGEPKELSDEGSVASNVKGSLC